jgi:phosphonoacetaldehyde hydrolase
LRTKGIEQVCLKHVKAVVFDWAGTVVDHGSLGPMGVFVEAFTAFGVAITIAEARQPMGIAKRPHVAALLAMPRIAEAWQRVHGHAPTEADVSAVYDVFVPKNIAVAARYADLIPGAAETARNLRDLGVKIGTTTGYTHEIMDEIAPVAARQGFAPDCIICTGDAPDGRPTPFLLYRAFLDLAVWPAAACIKIDDTEVGIAEGLNAGCWAVGVSVTGNLFGLSLADTAALPATEFQARRAAAAGRLAAAGAHYVIDGVAELMPIVSEIEGRLARGERP